MTPLPRYQHRQADPFTTSVLSPYFKFIIRYPSSRVADGTRVLSSRLSSSWLHSSVFEILALPRLCLKIPSTDEVWSAASEGQEIGGWEIPRIPQGEMMGKQ